MFSFLKSDKPASWGERLKQGLSLTRDKLGLAGLFGSGKIDEALYEELETVLLTSDVGVAATEYLLAELRARARRERLTEAGQLKQALQQVLLELLQPLAQPLDVSAQRPFVIMLAGVNGAGKTTTIGKLAHHFHDQGKSVLLAAGDTFRAAARGIDVVLADTAGRLPTQLHLMEEIKKVKRVIAKAEPTAPHEVLLVLDANTGQNALAQVKAFDEALGVTGLVLTKLDGSAKGGVIAAIARHKTIPLRFIGVGEGLDDLRPFDAREFVSALFGE